MKKISIEKLNKLGLPFKYLKSKKGYRIKIAGEVLIKEEAIKNGKVDKEIVKFNLVLLEQILSDEINKMRNKL